MNNLFLKTKLKLKKILRNHGLRHEKLKPASTDLFEATIGGKFAALNLLEENRFSQGTSIDYNLWMFPVRIC